MTILGKILNRKCAVLFLALFLMLGTVLGTGLGNVKASAAPVLISAVASADGSNLNGIQSGDKVILTFSTPVYLNYSTNADFDQMLTLSNSHSWFGESAFTNFNGNNVTITLSTAAGMPTIAVGDTITAYHNGFVPSISDTDGQTDQTQFATGTVTLTGSFGTVSSSSISSSSSKPKIKPGKTYIYTATYKTKTVFSSDQVKQAVKNAFYANSINHQLWFNSITITSNTIKANFTSRLKVKVKRSTVKALLKLAPAKAIPAISANQLKIKKSSL
jgi:hypothetical protein